jgi:hypothetical protein
VHDVRREVLAERQLREVRDDLVQVHVRRGPRTRLEHVDGELRVVLARDDLVGGLTDRAATSGVTTPVSSFAVAAAHFSIACAAMTSIGTGWPETGKFSTARCVLAPQRAPAGIVISPIVSRATRSGVVIVVPPSRVPARSAGPTSQG